MSPGNGGLSSKGRPVFGKGRGEKKGGKNRKSVQKPLPHLPRKTESRAHTKEKVRKGSLNRGLRRKLFGPGRLGGREIGKETGGQHVRESGNTRPVPNRLKGRGGARKVGDGREKVRGGGRSGERTE